MISWKEGTFTKRCAHCREEARTILHGVSFLFRKGVEMMCALIEIGCLFYHNIRLDQPSTAP